MAVVELDHGGRNTIDRTGVEEPVDDRVPRRPSTSSLSTFTGSSSASTNSARSIVSTSTNRRGVDVALERQHARPDRRADRVVHGIDMEVQAGDSRAIEDSLRMEVHGLGAFEPPLEDRVGLRVRLERVHSGARRGRAARSRCRCSLRNRSPRRPAQARRRRRAARVLRAKPPAQRAEQAPRSPGLDAHADAAASAWRCSSARSASVSSAMSPSSTWSSRCSVSLIRWSVTRLSAKL